MLSVEIAAAGHARGVIDEDAYLIDAEHRLFGVFDGLGSTSQSALASRLAAAAIAAVYRHRPASTELAGERALLAAAVGGAGVLIANAVDDGLTTASVVKVYDGPDDVATAIVCNVGDSRVYRSTATGELHQCTLDDSAFGQDWELQLQLGEVVVPSGALERAYFQLRHIMDRALGERFGAPRVWEVALSDGDVLLAVTDGVTDNLTFSELRLQLEDDRDDAAGIARRLVDAAVARSHERGHSRAKPDDTTAVAAVVHRVD